MEGTQAAYCSLAAGWTEKVVQASEIMGAQEVFLEQFCLNPALSMLLRKSRQLQGIWPPAQLSGHS